MGMAGQRRGKVVVTENGCYIDKVPPVKFGQWRECTYSNCVMLLLNVLGVKVAYEDIMGLTGSCYRLSMEYGWDPGSNIVDISYACLGIDSANNANRLYGIEYTPIEMDKTASDERGLLARVSLDSGIPVLIMGARGPAEWCLLLGYERTADGYSYFGRSYFDDDASKSELFTDNHYALANQFPDGGVYYGKLFTGSCEPTQPLAALKVSLESCIEMFKPHQKFGYSAYDMMIDSFTENKYATPMNGNGDIVTIIRTLTDARRAAHIYLAKNAEILVGENKAMLLEAASLYKEMFDTLQSAMPYGEYFDQPCITEKKRNELAGALSKIAGLEHESHDIIRKILGSWESM